MTLYLQFIFCLVTGLFGLCAAFKILFDTVLANWDPSEGLSTLFNPSKQKRSFIAQWEWDRSARSGVAPLNLPPLE